MLKLTDVDTFYGPIQALKKVSLTVEESEIVSLLGGNACGKSTTMKTILGLVRPKGGTVEFRGRRIDRLPPSEIVRSGIAPVLEARRLFPYLTIYENLLMGVQRAKNSGSSVSFRISSESTVRSSRPSRPTGTALRNEWPSTSCSTSGHWA